MLFFFLQNGRSKWPLGSFSLTVGLFFKSEIDHFGSVFLSFFFKTILLFFKLKKKRKKEAAPKKEAGGDAKHVYFLMA